jgi:hypothetical protein
VIIEHYKRVKTTEEKREAVNNRRTGQTIKWAKKGGKDK